MNIEHNLEQLLNNKVEALLEHDDYYQAYATSLKSAKAIKHLHQRQLTEFFELKEFRDQFEKAIDLIINVMPDFVDGAEYSQLREEFAHSKEHLVHYFKTIENRDDQSIIFQEAFGFSDRSLLLVYDFGSQLVKKGQFEEANSIFTFLSIMSPQVPSNWIAQGVCLQALERYNEALAAFRCAKFLSPENPAPYAYSLECYILLNDIENARLEFDELSQIVVNLSEDRELWESNISKLSVYFE